MPTIRIFLRLTVKSRKNGIFDDWNTLDEECIARAFSIEKTPFFPSQEPKKTPEKCPYCVTGAQKGVKMRTGLTKRQKTTEIFFDETKSRITVYTHNTDLKKRLTAYAEQYPDHCTMTDEDSETGYKAFEIEKGRLSFRLTAPYSEKRRRAASDYAKKVTNFMQQGD